MNPPHHFPSCAVNKWICIYLLLRLPAVLHMLRFSDTVRCRCRRVCAGRLFRAVVDAQMPFLRSKHYKECQRFPSYDPASRRYFISGVDFGINGLWQLLGGEHFFSNPETV